MKKLIINQLVEEMIQILITEVNNTENKSNLIIVHKTNGLVGGLVKKSIGKYSLDWSSDIIRDQVYASVYEAMTKVSKDFADEDINLNNNEFKAKVFALSEFLIKRDLIEPSKRNRDGEIVAEREELIDPQIDEETGKSRLEELLNEYHSDDQEMNHFLRWFHNNKSKILTKKQLAFINNELVDMDPKAVSNIKKRIADRVITAYNNTYNTLTDRQANLLDNKHIIESILDSKNFREEYIKYIDNEYIINTIVDNVSFDTMRKFNTGSSDKLVIREYRVALFKGLVKVNDKLQKEGVLDLF